MVGCSVLSGTMLRERRCTTVCQPTRVAVSRKEVHIFCKNIVRFAVSLKIYFSVLDGELAAFEFFCFVSTAVLVSGIEWTGKRCELRWTQVCVEASEIPLPLTLPWFSEGRRGVTQTSHIHDLVRRTHSDLSERCQLRCTKLPIKLGEPEASHLHSKRPLSLKF